MIMEPTAQLNYESKTSAYFEWPRAEVLPFVPNNCRRVLDVGCGGGAFGELLKQKRGVEVWGVEPVESAAQRAVGRLDRVLVGEFGSGLGLPPGMFDCVFFNDVLEHMLVPEAALQYARQLLAPGGVVVASVPNIRSFPPVWQLLFHGKWQYAESGILDKTHVRFFTKSSIVDLFRAEGYEVETISGINAYCGAPNVSRSLWRAYKLANTLCQGRFDDMKFQQFALVAKLASREQDAEAR